MAVNESRNLSRDLHQGMSDGLLIKAAPDRGGEVEDQARRGFLNEQHGTSTGDGLEASVSSRVNDGSVLPYEQPIEDYTWFQTQVG